MRTSRQSSIEPGGAAIESPSMECVSRKRFAIHFVQNLAEGILHPLPPLQSLGRVLMVSSPTVHRLYGTHIEAAFRQYAGEVASCVVRMGERRKTLATVARICEQAKAFGLGRRDVIVALGGGVCSDLVGFAASMFRRGVDHIRVPTTLIGQVDAAVGIKAGVNFDAHKNLLGAFHPPRVVLVDTRLLSSLDARHIREGLSEILKMALIADRPLFETLEAHGVDLIESRFQEPFDLAQEVVRRSVQLMLDQLRENPYEDRTLRRLVDMGHTFSPALESASEFTLSHGDAVAIDMAFTCFIAEVLGLQTAAETDRFVSLLFALGLPLFSPLLSVALCKSAVDAALQHRGGRLNLVLPTRIGEAMFADREAADAAVLQEALRRLQEAHAGFAAARQPSWLRQSRETAVHASPAL